MKVITNALWLSSSRVGADLLSFVLFAVISRTFGPAGTGVYSYAFAIASLVALVCTAGFEDYGIRQYARAGAGERGPLWRSLLSAQSIQAFAGVAALAVFLLLRGSLGGSVVILELSIYLIGWMVSHTIFIPALASQSMAAPAVFDLSCRMTAILAALVLAVAAHASLPFMLVGFPVAGIALIALALGSAARHGARPSLGRDVSGIVAIWRGTSAFAGSEILNQFYARADILMIAYFLGDSKVGWYATDIKFVEVGILPLVFLGTAAYPILSARGLEPRASIDQASRDFARIVFLLSGWLAVGMASLVPLLIVPLFGEKFAPSAALLPWFSVFALLKGWEVAFYRLLYAAHRQAYYLGCLAAGTVLIVGLNFALIPRFGIAGALGAAIACIAVVDLMAAQRVRQQLGSSFMLSLAARLAAALAATALVSAAATRLAGAGPWGAALLACGSFPVFGLLLGLIPHPRRSPLLHPS